MAGTDSSRWDRRDNILMSLVTIAFFLNILLLSNVILDAHPIVEELTIFGWGVLLVGALLVTLSILGLRKHGTTNLNRSGVYSIVRHPMYVGGMVMFASHVCFGQHWAVAASTAVGIVCCYLLILTEDKRLTTRFGQEYTGYMREVPRINFIWGMARVVRRPRQG